MSDVTRPRSIKLFAAAFMAQALASAIHNIVAPDDLQARLDATFQPGEWLVALFALNLAIRLGIASFLTWLVCFRASKVAKWLALVFVLGRFTQVGAAWTGLQQGNVHSIAWVLIAMVGLFAIVCLFLPDSRHWFATKGGSIRADAAVFE